MPTKRDPRLARAGVSGFNKPKRTPSHPKKSHVVVAKKVTRLKPYALVSRVQAQRANLSQVSPLR